MFANTDFAHSSANCWCSLVPSNKCLHDLIPVINIPESPPVCDPDFGFIIMPHNNVFVALNECPSDSLFFVCFNLIVDTNWSATNQRIN